MPVWEPGFRQTRVLRQDSEHRMRLRAVGYEFSVLLSIFFIDRI